MCERRLAPRINKHSQGLYNQKFMYTLHSALLTVQHPSTENQPAGTAFQMFKALYRN